MVTMEARQWDEFIDNLPDPADRYDYWPWPGVKLLNDARWPEGVSWSSKAAVPTERTS